MSIYNRKTNQQYKQPIYDKIYYIALSQRNPLNDSVKLDELLGTSGFVKT